jgi:AraC-like DNA-binding protein
MLLKPTKIRSYLAAMQARGFPAEAVLAGTGLAVEQLHDPALLVDRRQRERVILNMLRLTGNPALGLEIGTRAQLVDFGVLAYAQMSSPSLRQALALWMRYSSAVGTTVPIWLDERSPTDWRVVYEIEKPSGPVGWFCAEEIVALAVSLGPALAGPAFSLRDCSFSYEPPPHASCYEAFLRCPVLFNTPRTAMRPKSPDLDWLLPGNDPEFHSICLRHLDQVIRQIGHSRAVTSRLRSLLLSRRASPPTLEQAAAYLGMSARSLRRHLQQEETSYQHLVDQLRFELAVDYLREERRPIKEVGYDLGYRSVNAFRRAFKSWSGSTIRHFLDKDGK